MDWLKEWILQLVGVITLGAICDMIMIEGEMKKYVKPIIGFALIFTIIRPVSVLSEGKLRMDILQESINSSWTTMEQTDEKQKIHILELYEKNLAKKIEEAVYTDCKCHIEAAVYADNTADKIGGIDKVEVEAKVYQGEIVNTESIKRYIAEKFGVDDDKVNVTLRNRGED